jgi:hypothetical protein
MKTVRLAVAMTLTLVVVGGYAASQFVYVLGPDASMEFEAKVNDPRVHLLMLVIYVAAVLLAFIPDREEMPR